MDFCIKCHRKCIINIGGGLRAANSTTVSTVESGAKVTIEENLHNGLENYGTFTFEDGAELTITDMMNVQVTAAVFLMVPMVY